MGRRRARLLDFGQHFLAIAVPVDLGYRSRPVRVAQDFRFLSGDKVVIGVKHY